MLGTFGVSSRLLLLRPRSFALTKFHLVIRGKHSDGDDRLSQQIAEIEKKVERYKSQLRKHANSSFKRRELQLNMDSLRGAVTATRKKADTATFNTVANFPSHVSIEVLSNGTTHMAPCVVLRTPLKVYMFNCPEGTTRFLPNLRIRSNNIQDIFVTRGTWENISGISSVLLAKDATSLPSRLHGAVNMKHFLECIRPFTDSDFGNHSRYPAAKQRDPDDPVQYPVRVEEHTIHSHDSYEDAGVLIHSIPLLPDEGHGSSRKHPIDVAYLVELKAAPRKIDIVKVMKMKVPKGPMIGQLKNGEAVTLPDGSRVNPEDVYTDEGAEEIPRTLVVNVAHPAYASALYKNSLVAELSNGSKKVHCVVHFTSESVLQSPEYTQWATGLGSQCRHVVVNGHGPVVPATDSIYLHTRIMNEIAPSLFQELRPRQWRGDITQEKDLGLDDGLWIRAAPLQRFWMRKGPESDPIHLNLKDVAPTNPEDMWRKQAKEAMEQVKEESIRIEAGDPLWPRVTFLGTSSATPTKYRNVSGYLLETGPSSAFMVDVGEGSYGQLLTILDVEECTRILLNLHALFITHAHQDHMNGLYTIIEKRRDAFLLKGLPYRPLVLVCNKNVIKPLKTYTHCFEDLEQYVTIVDLATSNGHQGFHGSPKRGRVDLQGTADSGLNPSTCQLLEKIPDGGWDKETWQMEAALAVQVHHTRMANGFVFTLTNGRKVVFSGDTKPCDLLAEMGQGADLLIHEATFEDQHEQMAIFKKHSTMAQAVGIGKKMKAKNIILTHFSARYPKVPPLPDYLLTDGIGVAMDGLRVDMSNIHIVPLLNRIYREAFKAELFDIELKVYQRELKNNEKEAIDVKAAVATK